MSDYISRKAALEAFIEWGFSTMTVREVLSSISAADVAPVVHGRWIERTDGGEGLVCENCRAGYTVYDETPFCPNCGARMDGERAGL